MEKVSLSQYALMMELVGCLLFGGIACSGADSSSARRRKQVESGPSSSKSDEKHVEPVPVGAVHPNRVGERSYVEEYYEPTIIPPKGAAEQNRR